MVQRSTIYRYGLEAEQFGRLTRPDTSEACPVVIIIHGGYWKNTHTLDSYATNFITKFLSLYPVAVWDLEYRRMDVSGFMNNKIPYLTILSDVAAGIDYLRTIEQAEALNLEKLYCVGHSAGGYLAAWAASRQSIPEVSSLYREAPLMPKRVMSICGVLDLCQYQNLSQPVQVLRLLEGSPLSKSALRVEANPSDMRLGTMNGACLVHGAADEDVPISHSIGYANTQTHASVEIHRLDGGGHFSMLPVEGTEPPYWEFLKAKILEEINCLEQ